MPVCGLSCSREIMTSWLDWSWICNVAARASVASQVTRNETAETMTFHFSSRLLVRYYWTTLNVHSQSYVGCSPDDGNVMVFLRPPHPARLPSWSWTKWLRNLRGEMRRKLGSFCIWTSLKQVWIHVFGNTSFSPNISPYTDVMSPFWSAVMCNMITPFLKTEEL